MWKPKYFHIMTRNTVARTLSWSANHSPPRPSSPIAPSVRSASPSSGAKIMENRTPVMTSESTYGAKNSIR